MYHCTARRCTEKKLFLILKFEKLAQGLPLQHSWWCPFFCRCAFFYFHRQANKKLQKQMEVMMSQGKKGQAFKTPPPTVQAPTPKQNDKAMGSQEKKTKDAAKKKLDLDRVARSQGNPPPPSEAAKLARLRRLCEKKPSGKCNVPEDLHKRWLNGSLADREAMVEELEACHWAKEPLLKKIWWVTFWTCLS